MFRELVGTQGPQRLNHDSKQKTFFLSREMSLYQKSLLEFSLSCRGRLHLQGGGMREGEKEKADDKGKGEPFLRKPVSDLPLQDGAANGKLFDFLPFVHVGLRSKENRTGKN